MGIPKHFHARVGPHRCRLQRAAPLHRRRRIEARPGRGAGAHRIGIRPVIHELSAFRAERRELATPRNRDQQRSVLPHHRRIDGHRHPGAVFNIITEPKLRGLESSGVTPAALLDPHLRTQLSASILKSAGWMIESGLHWVFIGMLGVAILQLIVSRWMPLHSVDHVPSKSEMAEAMVG